MVGWVTLFACAREDVLSASQEIIWEIGARPNHMGMGQPHTVMIRSTFFSTTTCEVVACSHHVAGTAASGWCRTGRIHRHIIPLIGTRREKDLIKADINKVLKDIMAGKTRASVKTNKLRCRAIVRGGVGTATRTVGLLGGILTDAVEAAIPCSVPDYLHVPTSQAANAARSGVRPSCSTGRAAQRQT